MQLRPKSVINKVNCPLNDNEIDVIPEFYHHLNKCICFICTCGKHICPSQKRSFQSKDIYQSSYCQSFSRPSMTPTPPRPQTLYRKNNQKMDLETEYQKKFPGFTFKCVQIEEKTTPKLDIKLEGASQYKSDYPNWGPVDYYHTKRPQNPQHDTKLKFQGISSYEYFYKTNKIPENTQKSSSRIKKDNRVKIPIQSSSQRDYKKFNKNSFPKHEHKIPDEYLPLNYNPHQFKTTTHADYVASDNRIKDPNVIRRLALFNAK